MDGLVVIVVVGRSNRIKSHGCFACLSPTREKKERFQNTPWRFDLSFVKKTKESRRRWHSPATNQQRDCTSVTVNQFIHPLTSYIYTFIHTHSFHSSRSCRSDFWRYVVLGHDCRVNDADSVRFAGLSVSASSSKHHGHDWWLLKHSLIHTFTCDFLSSFWETILNTLNNLLSFLPFESNPSPNNNDSTNNPHTHTHTAISFQFILQHDRNHTILLFFFSFSFSLSFTYHHYYHYSHTPGTRQIGKATLTLHRGLGSRGRWHFSMDHDCHGTSRFTLRRRKIPPPHDLSHTIPLQTAHAPIRHQSLSSLRHVGNGRNLRGRRGDLGTHAQCRTLFTDRLFPLAIAPTRSSPSGRYCPTTGAETQGIWKNGQEVYQGLCQVNAERIVATVGIYGKERESIHCSVGGTRKGNGRCGCCRRRPTIVPRRIGIVTHTSNKEADTGN